MTAVDADKSPVRRQGPWAWASFLFLAALLGFIFYPALNELVSTWGEKEEYSYGYLIPFITLFLIWTKRDVLERIDFPGSWWGVAATAAGIGLFLIGDLSTFYHIMQYAFLLVLFGLMLAFTGGRALKVISLPLLFLLFMIPLPGFVLQKLSTHLQLISSEIGVAFIRLFGISVYLEGNVIDLGAMQLQVVEACSGLRYLFPLMALAFIAAYFFQARFWKRAVLFLSSIPITIAMNSFRIGAIGIMVEYWGKGMAQGFLHDFEGWAVFMACTGILVVEMWVLAKIGPDRRSLQDSFSVNLPAPVPKDAVIRRRVLPKPYMAAILIVAATAVAYVALPQRSETLPPRKELSDFPMTLGEWHGKQERLEQMYLDILKLDDYVFADYVNPDQQMVNFYVAYYATQNKGNSSHSPSTCIPGGGWTITSLTQVPVKGVMLNGKRLVVNRAVIQKDDYRQLVYYWFQERDRIVTDEYLVRWYIFWDALTRNRTDGALVRLVTTIKPGEQLADADNLLARFLGTASVPLTDYIPK